MKEIKAVIRPNKLSALRDALIMLPGFPGMTVSKVEGCSAPARHISA
jgi:nitrogen regulatory protein P-II 1